MKCTRKRKNNFRNEQLQNTFYRCFLGSIRFSRNQMVKQPDCHGTIKD